MVIMELTKKETDCVPHLNTKGCCFLCLETEEEITEAIRHLVSIRYLLRHLQITSFEKEILNGTDIKVDLCKTCENTLKGFTNVLAELEKVQMKMNYFLERINKIISCSKKDIKKVEVYSKRMTGDPEALAQLAFVDKLRKKLAVQSLAMQVGPVPCIKIQRTEVKKKIQIKEEIDSAEEFTGIAEGNDMLDNDDQEASKQSDHISQSLEPLLKPIKQEEEAGGPKVEVRKPTTSQSFYHMHIKETGMYKCRKCDKTLRTKVGIYDHYQSVHLKKRFKCDICSISSYVKPSDLKLHKLTCQETLKERLAKEKERMEYKFVCDLCGKRFRNKQRLTYHRLVVHKNNRYACDICDKKYTKLCSLNRHNDAVHLEKVFYCRICKKRIRHKTHLLRHEKICKYRQKVTECQAKSSSG